MQLKIWRRVTLKSFLFGICTCALLFLLAQRRRRAEAGKPWYFRGGSARPEKSGEAPRLFPEEGAGDRIIEQLMYVPPDNHRVNQNKIILLYAGFQAWKVGGNPDVFGECPVKHCALTEDLTLVATSDAILFKDVVVDPKVPRPPEQVWILYVLESPYHSEAFYPDTFDLVNWTATYREDSEIVTPYERWAYYDPEVKFMRQERNYATGKSKQVAWLVSNCETPNDRFSYAKELSRHIAVDVYGKCGSLRCTDCFRMLDRDYKFYLAFENSNCKDYITEKFFVNALENNVVPIVMGAYPEDYQRSAPEDSYIHVDEFATPADLAAYLNALDREDALYNSYFQWKGTGEFINTRFWCRLCAMLYAPSSVSRHYENVNKWWRGPGICN